MFNYVVELYQKMNIIDVNMVDQICLAWRNFLKYPSIALKVLLHDFEIEYPK